MSELPNRVWITEKKREAATLRTWVPEKDVKATEYVRSDLFVALHHDCHHYKAALYGLMADCECSDEFINRGVPSPTCPAHLYGDRARLALDFTPVCRGENASNVKAASDDAMNRIGEILSAISAERKKG